MQTVTITVRTRRYETLVTAVAALLEEYDVGAPPSDDFDIETLDAAGAFEEFTIVRDFAVRLGDARPSDPEDDENAVSIEVHAHHLVGLVAVFPDLVGAADVPEPDLSVVVQGLCHAYLAELGSTPE